MICVLLPFWTALLVRITAWIALLQNDGVVLSTAVALGVVSPDNRPQLVYNLGFQRFDTGSACVIALVLFVLSMLFTVALMRRSSGLLGDA